MSFLSNIAVFFSAVVLFSGCDSHGDQTLLPPDNARRVTVVVRVPDGITLMPMQMLYRSEHCKSKHYNSSNEAYEVPGFNGFKQAFSTQDHGDLWQQNIAIDGGGRCQWQLNSLRVSFKIENSHPLVKDKKIIETSYIFDFDNDGLSDGYATGRAKNVSGNLDLKTDFFPMIIINKMFHETSIEMFGGDTDYEQWSRRYSLKGTQNIYVEPKFYEHKVVSLEGDEERGIGMVINYPDGSTEHVRKIKPDYQKLLSLR